jgi:hypothetical protein
MGTWILLVGKKKAGFLSGGLLKYEKAVDQGAQTSRPGLGPASEWLLGGENSPASFPA